MTPYSSAPVPPITRLTGMVLRCDYPLARAPGGFAVDANRWVDGTWELSQGLQELGRFTPVNARTRVLPSEVVSRETPGWAKVLGVIGLLFFLVGLLFFLVKEERRTPAAVIEVTGADGRVFVLQVQDDPFRLRYGIGAD